jgi:CBS domain-containing protein
MQAKDVMSTAVLSVLANATVFEAAELLISGRVSAMPVVSEQDELVGIVSEADLMRRVEIGTAPRHGWLHRLLSDDSAKARDYIHAHSQHVSDVMTRDVVTLAADATLSEVAEKMQAHNIKRLPVVEDGRLIGIVSRADLLRALMSREPQGSVEQRTDGQLRRDVIQAISRQAWASAWPTNVVVSSGVVHLWGFVQSDIARRAYRVAAENVPGVRKVRNHLRAMPYSATMGV